MEKSGAQGETEKAIAQIRENRKLLENSPMKSIIEASTRKKVIPYSQAHSALLNEIVFLGEKIVEKHSHEPITRKTFEDFLGRERNAFRNNEVGDYCEALIKNIFGENREKFSIITEVIPLAGKGYPDLKIIAGKTAVFLEVKATSRPDKGSARDFYYSPGSASDKKIDCDGLHILIGFVTKQEGEGFLVEGFKLADVARIKVSLKPEFNTDNKGIYNAETLIA